MRMLIDTFYHCRTWRQLRLRSSSRPADSITFRRAATLDLDCARSMQAVCLPVPIRRGKGASPSSFCRITSPQGQQRQAASIPPRRLRRQRAISCQRSLVRPPGPRFYAVADSLRRSVERLVGVSRQSCIPAAEQRGYNSTKMRHHETGPKKSPLYAFTRKASRHLSLRGPARSDRCRRGVRQPLDRPSTSPRLLP